MGTVNESSEKDVASNVSSENDDVSTEEKKKFKLPLPVVIGLVQYLLVPVLSGLLTAGILAIAGLEKVGLSKFSITNLPTISMQGGRYTTYSGFLVTVGLGCVVGLIVFKIFRLVFNWTHLTQSDPSESIDAMPIPSSMGFIKALTHLVAMPFLIVLASYTILKLAEMGLLFFVMVDKEFRAFEMTLPAVVIVAALGSQLIFIFDRCLTFSLNGIRNKDIKLEEVR